MISKVLLYLALCASGASANVFPCTFNIQSTLTGPQATKPGTTVRGLGGQDINGDGFNDFVVAESMSNMDGADRLYVVFGNSNGLPAAIDLSTLNGLDGFAVFGPPDTALGAGVSGAGDMNGDGLDDIVFGQFALGAGAAYVLFGQTTFPATVNVSTLTGQNGFQMLGVTDNDETGLDVAGVGDLNADGVDDIAVGARYASGVKGVTYVVFGRTNGFPDVMDLGALTGSDGFAIEGAQFQMDQSGWSVSGAGDVPQQKWDFNGDGIDDIAVMSLTACHSAGVNCGAGVSYVIFGSSAAFPPTFSLATDLTPSNGVRFLGKAPSGTPAFWVGMIGAMGDVNSDGVDDVILSAPGSDLAAGTDAGEVYVVFGSAAGFNGDIDLAALDGINGFTIAGVQQNNLLGAWAARGLGDVNGDGVSDIIVGAWRTSKAHVIFGRSAFPATFPISLTNNAVDGVTLVAPSASPSNRFGWSVDGLLDQSGDGIADLILGQRGAGKAYVISLSGCPAPPVLVDNSTDTTTTPAATTTPAPGCPPGTQPGPCSPTHDWTDLTAAPGAPPAVGVGSGTLAHWAGSVYAFGGGDTTGDYSNVLRRYDIASATWTIVTNGTGPSARRDHSMVALDNSLYVFGGVDVPFMSPGALDDLWRFDIASGTWTQITAAGGPGARNLCGMAAAGGKVWVFGGATGNSGYALLGGLFSYDPASNAWADLSDPQADPSPRTAPAMVGRGDKVYLFGGSDVFTPYFDDFMEFDTVTATWTDLSGRPGAPSPRYYAEMAALGDKLYLFGGQTIVAGGGASHVEDLYQFDLVDQEWTDLTDSMTPDVSWSAMTASDAGVYLLGNPGMANLPMHLHVYEPGCDGPAPCIPIPTTTAAGTTTTEAAATTTAAVATTTAAGTTPAPTPDPNAVADPGFPLYGYLAIRPDSFPGIVGVNSAIDVLLLNYGNRDTAGAVVELSVNDWGVTYQGWQSIGSMSYDVLAQDNTEKTFNHVFQGRAHTCLLAVITDPGSGGNSNPNNDRAQINWQVVNAGETYNMWVPFGNGADEEIVVTGTQIQCLTNGVVGPCSWTWSGNRRMLNDPQPILVDAPGYGQDDTMAPNTEQIARVDFPHIPDEGVTVVVEALMNGEANHVMINVVKTTVEELLNQPHLCCIKSVRTRVMLEMLLADALDAYEAGDCKKTLKLLRMIVQKALLLKCDLSEEEVRCIEQMVLKLVDAGIMMAQESENPNKMQYLQEAHFFRRQGLYEAALMEAAKAC